MVDTEQVIAKAKKLFNIRVFGALTNPNVSVLQALLAKYPQMQITDEVFWRPRGIRRRNTIYNLVARSPRHLALIMPRASGHVKFMLFGEAFDACNESARLIIESGFSFEGFEFSAIRMLSREDLLALYLSVNHKPRVVRALSRYALHRITILPGALALIIQKDFDGRGILYDDEADLASIGWWCSCPGRGSARVHREWCNYLNSSADSQNQIFVESIQPKLALLVLARNSFGCGLSCSILWEELNQWQLVAPYHCRPSHEEILAYLKVQAASIVRRFGTDVCIAMQGLRLPALVTCEILQAVCSAWPRIPFHCYWNLAVAVKHFHA